MFGQILIFILHLCRAGLGIVLLCGGLYIAWYEGLRNAPEWVIGALSGAVVIWMAFKVMPLDSAGKINLNPNESVPEKKE